MISQIGKKNAKEIRNGSLLLEDDFSQVSPKSWENLAKMNELGFVTIDSQDATGPNERAYVSGFMSTKKALKFIHTFNSNTNFLAIATTPGKYHGMTRIPVTTDDKGDPITNNPYILEKSGITHLKKEAGLNMNEDITLINCIDTQWLRRANTKNGLFTIVVQQLNN